MADKGTGWWRVGAKVPINVYDEHGDPVCQCQNAAYAERIVEGVNRMIKTDMEDGDEEIFQEDLREDGFLPPN